MAKRDSHPDPMSIKIGDGAAVASIVAGSNIAPHLAYHDLRKWIEDPNQMKPGALMPAMRLNDHDLDAVTKYMTALR